jgi:hypothetical protein
VANIYHINCSETILTNLITVKSYFITTLISYIFTGLQSFVGLSNSVDGACGVFVTVALVETVLERGFQVSFKLSAH